MVLMRRVAFFTQLPLTSDASADSITNTATLPIVYCTVERALKDLAGLKAGDTILIHAVAGGVGLAAIQFAQRVGANIVATCSTAKREYLRSLGVTMFATSRDGPQFVEEMKQILGPTPKIDVVLNSLSDDYIEYSMKILSPNGLFVEIGKSGIWSQERAYAERPEVYYHILELDTLASENPHKYKDLLTIVCADVDLNKWAPIPTTTFDFTSEYQAAFSCLRHGTKRTGIEIR